MKPHLSKIAAIAAVTVALALLLNPSGGFPFAAASADTGEIPADRRGAIVDEIVFTRASDPGKAVGQIETGAYDLLAQGVTSRTIFHRIRDSQRVMNELSYGNSMELTLNPAGPEFVNGELNPFHVPEIREALNWLINRRHVAEELYGGLAVSRYLPMSTAFPDYARLADVARALEQRYRHDPDRARRVIEREMEALGATFADGRWLYDGEPVRITVLIRTEDERVQVGDYVANLLEDLGFQVERMYRTAEEATRIWIATDPAAGRWHVYTGGWIATVISRDQADNLSYYYTPRGRPEPLWQAYTPDPEFDEIADRLQRRDYSTLEEREALLARGLELAMKDSARIWVVDQLNIWPRAANVELAVDLAGGVSGSRLWPYTIRHQDRVGGRMVIGLPSLLTEPWNPVAGSNWIFDQMIIRALHDPELLPDPFTGLYWPQRIDGAEVTVIEGVPVTSTLDWLSLETVPEIVVPKETWIDWDVNSRRFITVGEKHPDGITARTRTRIFYEDGYLSRLWHDGSVVSLADMVLPWILNFERADENSRIFDPAHVPVFETFQRHFRGWNIVSFDPLVIDVYSDQIFPDAETIVAARTPSVTPWHTLALGIRAEEGGELAFSSNMADRRRVNWLSLVAGPSLPILDRHLDMARRDGFVPYVETLGAFVRDGEVEARYEALADWRAERRHFWVGTGPVFLHAVYPVENVVIVRRFEDFPDPSGKWLRFSRPEIPVVELDGPVMVEQGDDAVFDLRILFDGETYPEEAIDAVQYMLFDGAGDLAQKGAAQRTADGRWTIVLSAEVLRGLGMGANSLEVAVTSDRVALPAFASHAFATISSRAAAGAGEGQ